MAPTSVLYSPPMEDQREPDVIQRPVAPPVDEMPPPAAVAGPIPEIPVSERLKAALIREHRTIT